MKQVPVRDVDAYLAALPEAARKALEDLRRTIEAAAPQAVEVLSYQIPIYKKQRTSRGLLCSEAAL